MAFVHLSCELLPTGYKVYLADDFRHYSYAAEKRGQLTRNPRAGYFSSPWSSFKRLRSGLLTLSIPLTFSLSEIVVGARACGGLASPTHVLRVEEKTILAH